MSRLTQSLCWGASLILLAVANATGLVADEAAQVLFIVLPVTAAITLRKACTIPGRAAV